jgi:hypothetical protein
VTLTVDDAGMTVGTDTYYASTVLPIANAAGVPVGVAITVGYPLAQTLIPEFQGWVNAGLDVTAHSISHIYCTNTDARNSARQDTEIEATKARVVRLEQIAATNTEGRIRTEVQLVGLRDGQAEIKAPIQAHDGASREGPLQK